MKPNHIDAYMSYQDYDESESDLKSEQEQIQKLHIQCYDKKICINPTYRLPDWLKKLNIKCSIQKIDDAIWLDTYNDNIQMLLNNLPNSLTRLDCTCYCTTRHTQITSLSEKLPKSLKELYCDNNRLVLLPDKLPKSLEILHCYRNRIIRLPDNLPDSLVQIGCSDNKISKLPKKLPKMLREMQCCNNQITKLPDNLPDSLVEFWCDNNQITELPDKLPKSLEVLHCAGNKITSLTKLPDTLKKLDCSRNYNLTYLPLKLRKNNCQVLWIADVEKLYWNRAIIVTGVELNKKRWKRRFYQWIICKKMHQYVDPDCSKIITGYV